MGATLQDPVVDAGEPTQYQISVLNGQADSPPPPPAVAGLTFQYLGEQNRTSYFFDSRTGGREINAFVYTYSVRAMRAGRYVIPGQEVAVHGTSLRTMPITLLAQDNGSAGGAPPPSQAVTSELLVPKKSAYVGESIPVEVRASFGTEVRGHPDPDPVLNGEGFSVQKFTPPAIGAQVVDGVRYNTASYKSAIAGLKIGTLTVGPADTEPVVRLPVSPSRRRRQGDVFDQFNNLFGGINLGPEQKVKVRAEAVTVEIRPLPAGKPADFSGGVGQFKLDAEAEPRRAQAGDPVTVRLLLSGQGNFERVTPPTLADERGLKTYPPSAKFKADDEVGLSGVKTFEQVVIADGPRASLPAYRFSYLDPATGKYVVLETPPVAVRIEGNAATPAPVAVASAQAGTPTPAATSTPTPARAAEDILYIRADPGPVRDRAAFLPLYQRRGFWLAQTVPLAALLALALGTGLRAHLRSEAVRGQLRRQREQADLRSTLRREDTSRRDFYAAATRLARLRTDGKSSTPPMAGAVQDIFHRHDELAYSGGQVALEPVPADERRGVLATLDALGKNGK